MDFDKISVINVDFPEPDTPVTDINLPKGKFTVKFFKLFSFAPLMTIFSFFPFLRTEG